jgi:sec-independent protein translocase protein TatC
MLVLACGLMFQLPMVVFFLSKIGVVTPDLMREYRKHAIVAILVIAAVITPPDPFSQLLITLPVYSLYEMSIFISAMVHKKMAAEERQSGLQPL